MSPEHRARIEASRPTLIERARQEYGLELNPGPFDTDSYPALVVEKYADAQGKGNAFHEAVQDAYWLHAQPIGNLEVLKEIAAKVGLPTENFEVVLENPTCKEAVAADVEQAYEYGLTGVPAVVFENKYLVSGAQPYEVFRQVVEKIQENG